MSDKYILLNQIDSPDDLKRLPPEKLPELCREIRQYIIEVVSKHPGHLGASLGVVELTVALHYVFDFKDDKLIWDVGHQAYAHKIITGRRDAFAGNRQYHGISGFPKMSESRYDSFGAGHASISISAALGMATASYLEGNNSRQHVAVIGDGSMTGGEAFEGLNNTGIAQANMLVILNDNGMAIDQSVGALSRYLLRITTSRTYNRVKNKAWNFFTGKLRRVFQNLSGVIKSSILKQSNLFESLGMRYFGPVDGHDVLQLVKVLQSVRNIKGPRLLHCITIKGKGLQMAETHQAQYHAPGCFDPVSGEILKLNKEPDRIEKYQVVFGKTVCEMARENPRIVGITPAMLSGCSLDIMQKEFPDRVFDTGITEQHAVTFSAGLAASGYIPFCTIYSTFLQRAYDQIIHDVALQRLPVIFCIDRAGLVGEDGATHHGLFDLAYLRCIPNMVVCSPLNETELRNLMVTAVGSGQPFAIRYPRGKGVQSDWTHHSPEPVEIGRGRCVREGGDVAVLSIGPIGNHAIEAAERLAAEGISVAVYDMRFLKPLDEELLHTVCQKFPCLLTVENGTRIGGLGSAVSEFMTRNRYTKPLSVVGVDDYFVEQGSVAELEAECGMDVSGIMAAIRSLCGRHE
ncbi:MAG: 1-deoxy-D-xylulose-5-phosphate synthase [Bacteroidales bacterium]|nr:1-deoxy-D-xylulose-5-phosphate synthase [Bacteroidales bacterium]